MAGPLYIATNLISDSSPTITVSDGTASGSSTGNLSNGDPAKQWVSGTAWTSSPQTVEADFGGATTADMCAIFNVNFPSDSTIKLQKWNGASYDDAATFTIDAGTSNANYYVTFTSASPTKWQLELTTGADTSVVPSIGEWVLGEKTQLSRAVIAPHDIRMIPNVIRNQAAGGNPRTQKVSNSRIQFPLEWRMLTSAQAVELSLLFLYGGPEAGSPFAFVPFPDESSQAGVVSSKTTDSEVYFVEATIEPLIHRYESVGLYSASMELTELPVNITL